MRSKRMKKLAEQASKDKNGRVRRFWTYPQMVFTLAAIEDLQNDDCTGPHISSYFLPFLWYLHLLAVVHPRKMRKLQKEFEVFAKAHGVNHA